MMRPVRELMSTLGDQRQLSNLFLATFLAMLVAVPLYSALVSRLHRRWLVRVVFHFFCGCLAMFGILLSLESEFANRWVPRVFFVWISVYSLFATSVFWSVMADVFSNAQGKRLFGIIAAGGTAGAICGSLITTALAPLVPKKIFLLLPIVLIQMGLFCAWRIERGPEMPLEESEPDHDDEPTGGGLWDGVLQVTQSPYLALICAFLMLVQLIGTHMYFMQADIVKAQVESEGYRTQLFASLDLATQILTLGLQLGLTGGLLRRWGVSVALVVLPLMYCIGLLGLAVMPSLGLLAVVIVLGRGIGYGITVPTREVLFTVVSRQEKYKSKSFIDTVVLRGGDALAGKLFEFGKTWGISLPGMNWMLIPVSFAWAGLAWRLGRQQKALAESRLSAEGSSH